MDPKQSLADIEQYIANLEAERDGLQARLDQLIAVAPQIIAQLRPLFALLETVTPGAVPTPEPAADKPAPASEPAPEPQAADTSKFRKRYTEEDAAAWAHYASLGHSAYQIGLLFGVDLKTVKSGLKKYGFLCTECGAMLDAEERDRQEHLCDKCRPAPESGGNNGHGGAH